MASVQERFQAAVNVIKGLPKNGPYQPSPVMMLKFYGLFKQATEGPCQQKRPAFWDIIGKAKWDSYNGYRHLTKEQAMQQYVESLQEIIETMSFTENVQNFVGSLQGLENINLDELEMIAPGMKQMAKSHPNSPFNSRTNSPHHGSSNNIIVDEEPPLTNGHISSSEEVETSNAQNSTQFSNTIPQETVSTDYSQLNGNIDQSDDEEYVDPFDIQHELNEHLQQNNQILKQVQATVSRMNSDISSVNQRIFDLEKTVRDLKVAVVSSKAYSSQISTAQHKSKYPKWWPFSDISPAWFFLLIVWPFFVRRLQSLMAWLVFKVLTNLKSFLDSRARDLIVQYFTVFGFCVFYLVILISFIIPFYRYLEPYDCLPQHIYPDWHFIGEVYPVGRFQTKFIRIYNTFN